MATAPAKRPKVVLGNINAGELRMEMVVHTQRVTYLEHHPDFEITQVLFQPGGPYLDDNRNQVVLHAYSTQPDFDYLLFVDSDISGFTAEDVAKLVRWAEGSPQRGIVGGAYYSPAPEGFYVVAYDLGPGKHGDRTYLSIPYEEVKPHRRPRRCDVIGTGFMLISRKLLDEMSEVFFAPQPWFAEQIVDGHGEGNPEHAVHLGEDMTFCARAQYLGYSVWLHQGVRLTHHKTMALAWEDR